LAVSPRITQMANKVERTGNATEVYKFLDRNIGSSKGKGAIANATVGTLYDITSRYRSGGISYEEAQDQLQRLSTVKSWLTSLL